MGRMSTFGRALVLGAYRLGLRLMPRDFRRDFGEEMARLVQDRLGEGRGVLNGFRVLARAYRDLLFAVIPEHLVYLRARRERSSVPGSGPVREGPSFSALGRDVRHAFRVLRTDPGYALISVWTLGAGIGATTVAFSLVNGILLRPLPFPDPDELVFLMEEDSRGRELMLSYPNFDDWRSQTVAFQDIAAVQFPNVATVQGGEEPARATVLSVSREFFRVMEINPLLGRPVLPDENRPGGERVLVSSYEFWSTALGSQDDLESITLSLYGGSWKVVGVMPPGFSVLEGADLYIPMELAPIRIRDAHNYRGIGRLAPGFSIARADQELDRIASAIRAEYGDESAAESVSSRPLREVVIGEADTPLLIILGASWVLLLIACANQASHLLARAEPRQKEMSVRSALGASRGRLVQQLLTEGGVLALLGCGLAVMVTFVASHILRIFGTDLIPRLDEAVIDVRVFLVALLAAAGTTVAFSLFPTIRATGQLSATLATSGQRGVTRVRGSTWNLLVGAEVAMAVLLVVGMGLLVRSLWEIVRADTGFIAESVVTVELDLSGQGLNTEEARTAFFDGLERSLSDVPEVESVGLVNRLPLQGGSWTGPVLRSPVTDRSDRSEWAAIAGWRVTDEDYFSTMEIRVLSGRLFDRTLDRPNGTPAAVLNQSLAARAFPGENPIGKQVQALWDSREADFTVIGVVAEARDWRLEPGSQPEMFVFWPQRLEHTQQMTAVLRPMASMSIPPSQVRDAIRTLAPGMPVELRAMESWIGESLKDRRFTVVVLGTFALTALMLAAVGIYGVVSYSVSQRKREIGIRLALGARPAQIRKRFIRDSMVVVGIGAVAGLVMALLAGRLMESLLYGVTSADPLALGLAPLVLFSTATLSILIPVFRLTRIHPSTAIEVE